MSCAASASQPLANASKSDLLRLVSRYFRKEDLRALHHATGTPARVVLDRLDEADVPDILSTKKILLHPLNAIGLHPLRALLTERLTDAVREQQQVGRGGASPLYRRIVDDGIVVLHDIGALLNVSTEKRGWHNRAFATSTAATRELRRIFHTVSGYRSICATGLKQNVITHKEEDDQHYMHIDSSVPLWKVFFFQQPTTHAQGPFHYVFGSHRNDEGKLRWLFDRSRRYTTEGSRPALYDAGRHRQRGPYADETHGWQDSVRMLDFDPRAPLDSARALLARYGLGAPTPVVTPSSAGVTLVIVDTSGLHYRGRAPPGTKRKAWRLIPTGSVDHGGGLPRKNPAICEEAQRAARGKRSTEVC